MSSCMKTIKYLFFISAVSIFLFCSCSKKNNPAPANSTVSLKFNSSSLSTSNITVSYASNTTTITGLFLGQSTVQLSIPNPKIGTFDITTSGAAISFANGTSSQDVYKANTGTIVVTSLTSTTISGTFEGTANNLGGDNATITNGHFQADLP